MARKTRRAAKKRLLKKILAPLLTLLAAALTRLQRLGLHRRREPAAAAMPEGALVSVQVIDVGQGSSLLLHTAEHRFSSTRGSGRPVKRSLRSSTRGGSPPLT